MKKIKNLNSKLVGCRMRFGRRGKFYRVESIHEEIASQTFEGNPSREIVITAKSVNDRTEIEFLFSPNSIENFVQKNDRLVYTFKKGGSRSCSMTIFVDTAKTDDEFAFAT